MKRQKGQTIAHFNEDLSNIIFYKIEDNNKEFILIREKGTKKYILYNNKENTYAEIDEFISWDKLDINKYQFKFDRVFFWGDSPFVTDYALPDYSLYFKFYEYLLQIREAEVLNLIHYKNLMEKLSFIDKIITTIYYKLIRRSYSGKIKRKIKELKVIW